MTDVTTLPPEALDRLRADLSAVDAAPAYTSAATAHTCASPILLSGSSRTVNAVTGEVVRAFSSADLPDRLLTVACGNRRATVCPACSKVYAADAFQLITAGLVGTKGLPVTVAQNPRVFATFTAPSFGPVHLGPDKHGHARPCHPRRDGSGCGRWHKPGDPVIGAPLDPAAYDYDTAALWNASASALWRRFTVNLPRDLARLLGMTLAEFKRQAAVTFAKVAEYQTRGAIHFHAVIRLDGAGLPGTPAPAWATFDLLADAVRGAARRSQVTTPASDRAPARDVVFGGQLDLRPITSKELADGRLTDRSVASYIAKYATKSAHTTGALDRTLCCRECSGAGRHGTYTDDRTGNEVARLCRRCLGSGLRLDLADLTVSDHTRTLIDTVWRLGAVGELAPLKLRRWAHMLGFRGHFLTKGRRYSTTFAALREARREHARQETRDYLAAFGLLDGTATSTETIVIGSWAYAGRAVRPRPLGNGGDSP